jgi:acetyl esterase/lipase
MPGPVGSPLRPGGIALSATAILTPFLAPSFSDARLHPAVLVLPGGGYAFTSLREGPPVAAMFNGLDCAAFVLEYTTADRDPSTTIARMLGEVEAALDLIAANAAAWRVDPSRLYLCGFSAGGHLAALAGNRFGGRIDRVILCYPALRLRTGWTPRAVAGGGRSVDPSALLRLFDERPVDSVSPASPRTFLWHTVKDDVADVAGSVEYLLRLVENRVPCEAHLYGWGRHGLALASRASAASPVEVDDHVASWTRLVGEWIGDGRR